jgi:hypothetical protein
MVTLLDTLRKLNAERGNKIHVKIEVTFLTFIHHELFIVFYLYVYEKSRHRFLLLTKASIIISKSTCTYLCIYLSDKLDSRSSRLIVLKDLSIVSDDTGIVSKILMIMYIAGNKLWFACRVSSSLSGLSSTRAHLNF